MNIERFMKLSDIMSLEGKIPSPVPNNKIKAFDFLGEIVLP